MIKINDLKKAYSRTLVLDIEELSIPAGESFGLVGNNGAGKTTMFSLLLDLIKASKGNVLLKDLDVAKTEDWKKFTGSYLDEGFLIEFLTPEEYFYFVGSLNGMNNSDVDLFLANYESFFNNEIIGKKKYIRGLSKGNQKKVGIIAALLGQSDILILDEPFANLDPRSQIQLKNLINDLPKEKTILISSHDLSHITEVCERIVVLEKGKVVKDISTNQDTLQELESYFTA